MQKISRIAIAAVCAAFACSSGAEAKKLVAHSFDKIDNFNQHAAYCASALAGYCTQGFSRMVAQSFTVSTAGTLDHLDLGLGNIPLIGYLAQGAQVALVADNKGAPDTQQGALEEWTIAKLPLANGTILKAAKVTSKLHPALSTGKTYWIVVQAVGFDGSVNWFANSLGLNGGILFTSDGGQGWTAGSTQTAYDVWIQ